MRLFPVLLLLIVITACCRAEAPSTDTARQTYQFAIALINQRDYPRAVGEFKRYEFLAGTPEASQLARYAIAICYQYAHEWPRAIEAWRYLRERFPRTPIAEEALYHQGECYLGMENIRASQDVLTEYLVLPHTQKLYDDDAAFFARGHGIDGTQMGGCRPQVCRIRAALSRQPAAAFRAYAAGSNGITDGTDVQIHQ